MEYLVDCDEAKTSGRRYRVLPRVRLFSAVMTVAVLGGQ